MKHFLMAFLTSLQICSLAQAQIGYLAPPLASNYYPAEQIGSELDASTCIALGDVDKDGDIDVVIGNDGSNNRLYFNNGRGGYNTVVNLNNETKKTRGIVLVDIDKDGDLDVLAAEGQSSGNAASTITFNDGSGNFSSPVEFEPTSSTYAKSIAAGDVDKDGDLDVVIAYYGRNRLCLQGATSTSWTCNDLSTDAYNTNKIILADMDGDGDPDAVTANSGGAFNILYVNDGSGNFATASSNFGSSADSTFGLDVGDIDNDGDLDIVAGEYGQVNTIYLNDGKGNFNTSRNIGAYALATYAVRLGDLDRDGDLDLLVGNRNQHNTIYLNDGNGVFNDLNAKSLPGEERTQDMALADIDNDNDIDVLSANFSSANILFRNNQRQITTVPILSSLLLATKNLPPQGPAAPSNITSTAVTQTSDGLTVQWTDNSSNETSFVIYRSETLDPASKTEIATTDANVLSFIDSGLSPCTQYYYWVAAKNSIGETLSTVVSGKTAPAAPISLMAYKGPGVFSIHLNWQKEECAASYHVYAIGDYSEPYQRQTTSGPITDEELTITDVPENTYYFFRVSAIDSNGQEGDLSCVVAADTPQGGATAIADSCFAAVGWAANANTTNLWGTWNNYSNQVKIGWDSVPLSWNAVGDILSHAQKFYVQISLDQVIWYDLDNSGSVFSHPITPADSTPMVLTIPVSYSDTTYYFRIQTEYWYDLDHDGEDDYVRSTPFVYISARTASTASTVSTILPAPGLSTSKYYPIKIMVGWSTVAGATGYKLYRSTNRDSGFTLKYTSNSGTIVIFNDTSVWPYVDYWYKVCAVNSDGVCGTMSSAEYGNASNF